MAGGPSIELLRDIQLLFDAGTAIGLSDRQLLERFTSHRDSSAFEGLVSRHGPMVLRVCANLLRDPNDVQDAFQATFLILVRRSGSIRRLESVGSWLYGVASRVAARARVGAARRRAIEERAASRVSEAVTPSGQGVPGREDVGPIVQEEVRRLPEKYRAVVVLCYWEGLTQEQAAVQLGIPLGTVRSRVARARNLLQRRLLRRGVTPVASLATPALEAGFRSGLPSIPNPLLGTTIRSAANVAAGQALTDATSVSVAALVHSVLRSMVMMKLKIVGLCVALIGIGAWGASLAAPQASSERAGPKASRVERPRGSKAQPRIEPLKQFEVDPPDLLLVEILEALPGRPISGERLIRPDGKISLGFYGEVYVAGLTPIEVKEKVVKHLQKYLSDEFLGLVKVDASTGKVIERVEPKDTDRVFVDVTAYNSKNYYVQGAVLVAGKMPITGHDTVLDAISNAGGLAPQADRAHVVLYRPEKDGTLRTLPVNVDQITMGNDPTTNYQLLPGDRLVIPELPKTEAAGEKPATEQPPDEPPKRSNLSRYFDRGPDQQGAPPHDVQPASGNVERAALRRLERRMVEVERKLDLILEALKTTKE